MAMTPEQKAKQKARQETEWAKQRGEVPAQPFVSVEYAMEPGKAEPIITPTQFDEPEMPISVTVDEVLAKPETFPPAGRQAAKEMKAESKSVAKRKTAAKKK